MDTAPADTADNIGFWIVVREQIAHCLAEGLAKKQQSIQLGAQPAPILFVHCRTGNREVEQPEEM
ncbi:MAG: hypothetical protein ACKPKO_07340, partial [Candidatus Fonsibacter sp.]